MANNQNTTGYIGVPDMPVEGEFRVWDRRQLFVFNDANHSGRKMPNLDDLIVDYSLNSFLRVIEVDFTAFTWKAEPFNAIPVHNAEAGSISGVGSGPASDYYRVYIDTDVRPATLRVHPLLRIPGSENEFIRIFRGTDVGESGEVISAFFQAGEYAGEKIPLELVAIENVTNYTLKTAKIGACKTDNIKDGELVSVVVYNDVAGPVMVYRCYVVLTNMVLSADSTQRQVKDIQILSPFLDKSDHRLLQLPINLPLDDVSIMGRITYMDGYVDIPIDGTRLSLDGLRNSAAHDNFYLSSQAGQELPLLFTYKLPPNETYIGNDLSNGQIIRDYRATTLSMRGAYSVKLCVVPRWNNSAIGYRLDYYLFNLERGTYFNVTAHVKPGVNSPAYSPKLYGVKQSLVVTVDLRDVSGIFAPFIFVQNFSITLMAEADERRDNWYIEYVHNNPDYGRGVKADYRYVNNTYWTVDISCGARDKTEWLDKLYKRIYPLYDARSEAAPLTPTHFHMHTGGNIYLLSVDDWVNPIRISNAVVPGETLLIEWFHRTPTDDLHLGMSPLPVHQI